ncbi:unnamed protein product [Meloidogyne enterolobii]|uniref:Uncharacterized protein n=1 Tax=Meloidogyne enterolobii TaxID=390850 RepID=A0ACB0YYX6_MELEN
MVGFLSNLSYCSLDFNWAFLFSSAAISQAFLSDVTSFCLNSDMSLVTIEFTDGSRI